LSLGQTSGRGAILDPPPKIDQKKTESFLGQFVTFFEFVTFFGFFEFFDDIL
jgi:hypothetical protein